MVSRWQCAARNGGRLPVGSEPGDILLTALYQWQELRSGNVKICRKSGRRTFASQRYSTDKTEFWTDSEWDIYLLDCRFSKGNTPAALCGAGHVAILAVPISFLRILSYRWSHWPHYSIFIYTIVSTRRSILPHQCVLFSALHRHFSLCQPLA